jgi:KaiC/GvpD/RAD55 family RecA-like ATPase
VLEHRGAVAVEVLVVALERLTMEFGAARRRRIEVQKMRGSAFLEGWHDYVIRRAALTCTRGSSPPSTTAPS